jgi:protease secretion system membrane fusion protein
MQDYQKEVRTQLSDVEKEAEALSARLEGQKFELDNVEVKSPVSGTVTGLACSPRAAWCRRASR